MGMHLGAGLVQIVQRSPRKFKLPTRFQRDRGTVHRQSDDIARFVDRLPAKALQTFQYSFDALRAVIGQSAQVASPVGELFMLGTYAPTVPGFFPEAT